MMILTRSSGAVEVLVTAPAAAPQKVCLMPVTIADSPLLLPIAQRGGGRWLR